MIIKMNCKCKRGKCAVCRKCLFKTCPIRCNCNGNGNESSKNDHILLNNIITTRRSSQWSGHIIPGVDVPSIPLKSLDFRQQSNASMKVIDKTIPNLIDKSRLDSADLAEVNRVSAYYMIIFQAKTDGPIYPLRISLLKN